MGHNISALIIKGSYDKEIAKEYDLRAIDLEYGLTLFLIDSYYITYWQHALELKRHLKISPPNHLLIPTEEAISYLIEEITSAGQTYVLIHTDYAGGTGSQFAAILEGREVIDPKVETINDGLKHLGVEPKDGMDEFDSINLSQHRSNPPHLNKYQDLCDELGL